METNIMPIKPSGYKKMSIVFGNGKNTNSRNSRDIHKYLGVQTAYSRWIKRRIESQGVEENVDYTVAIFGNGNSTKFKGEDYIVTDDFAKHLGMLEKTPKGKEVRNYFIYMEKLAKYLLLEKIKECDVKTQKLVEKETSKLETIISNQEKKIEKLSESIYAKRRAGSSQVVTRIIKDYNIAIDPSDLNEILSSQEFGILEKEYYETYTFKPVIGQRVAIRVGQSVMMDVDSILAIVDELEIPRGELEEKKTNLFID